MELAVYDLDKLIYVLHDDIGVCLLDEQVISDLEEEENKVEAHLHIADKAQPVSISVYNFRNLVEELSEYWKTCILKYKYLNVLEQKFNSFNTSDDHILPSIDSIFRCFKLCSGKPKVVILNDEPYIINKLYADGLAYSTSAVPLPLVLTNIFEELNRDLKISRTIGDLEDWATQGVLLLNCSLTSVFKKRNAHKHIWSDFTNYILDEISSDTIDPPVFLLWGNYTDKLVHICNGTILKAGYPSSIDSTWINSKPFSKCNTALITGPINW